MLQDLPLGFFGIPLVIIHRICLFYGYCRSQINARLRFRVASLLVLHLSTEVVARGAVYYLFIFFIHMNILAYPSLFR